MGGGDDGAGGVKKGVKVGLGALGGVYRVSMGLRQRERGAGGVHRGLGGVKMGLGASGVWGGVSGVFIGDGQR